MANQEQLDILKQSVEAWNKWRVENPNLPIDLSHTDLFEADLSHADLSHADLSHADLFDADLSHADLFDADLSHADLSHANLSKAYLAHYSCTSLERRGPETSLGAELA
jgi:uncharacterized protein YjbI with pentapeptide repeats